MMPQIFLGPGWCDMPMSAIRSKLSKVEEEDEFQFVFPASPQLLKEGLCRSERRQLFRRYANDVGNFVLVSRRLGGAKS
jgi:hypothetical protein